MDDHEEISDKTFPSSPRSLAMSNPNKVRIMVSLPTRTVNCLFPYDESTTTRTIADLIKAKFPTVDFSEYGLVFAFSVWLEDDKKLMADCGLEGEVLGLDNTVVILS
jgi:hypothetical protein